MFELILIVGFVVVVLLQFGLHKHLVDVINAKSAAFNANPTVQSVESAVKARL